MSDRRIVGVDDRFADPGKRGIFQSDRCTNIAKRIMKRYDTDGKGYIEIIAAGKMLMDLYQTMNKQFKPTATDIASYARIFDSVGKGQITYDDVLQAVQRFFG